jgi:hypothetical protein
MKNFKAKLLGVSLFVLTLATSCNHDFDKVVPPSKDITPPSYKAPKILYIIADGARGQSVRDAVIPNLSTLLPHSIYCWNSLADTTKTDATNWADMITGVKKEKHNVLTEDFAGNKLATYTPIFQRIKSIKPTLRIAAFSASAAFKANLTGGTDVSEGFTSDDALKTRMVNFLATDTASIVVGEFAGIEAAGKASGFDNSFAPYKTAINTFDTQVGAIITAVTSRATYAKENWMIIIASNRGGAYTLPAGQDDRTILSNTNANTFTIIYNAGYNQTFIPKPFVGNSYVGNSIRFLGYPEKGIAQINPAKNPAFNLGDTAGFTISIKVKKHKNPVNVSRGDYYYQWPGFVGKRGNNAAATPKTGWGDDGDSGPGWDFCVLQNRWRFFFAGKTSGAFKSGAEIDGLEFTGDTWHDLTAVVEKRPNGHAYVMVYTDGIAGITGMTNGPGSYATPQTTAVDLNVARGNTLSADVNIDNRSVLRLGYTPGEQDGENSGSSFGKIDVELKELKIFRVAIPSSIVKQYACDQTLNAAHPYYPYLMGYWPMDEGAGATIADKGPNAADFTISQALTNGARWTAFADLICSPIASDLSLVVPKNSDIPAQIISWFNIARQSSWALDGKVWIAN